MAYFLKYRRYQIRFFRGLEIHDGWASADPSLNFDERQMQFSSNKSQSEDSFY